MRTLVTVSMVRPGDVSIVAMVSSVAFRLAHQIRREFMLVDDLNRIILMRKGHDLIVNDGMEANYELDIYDLHFEVRQLLLLDI
ncbi:MAG: hypothetical protein OXG53_12610 [Chloroflexi bacterium]|nr:hypothetical protein [Chloroflexota bacterium]